MNIILIETEAFLLDPLDPNAYYSPDGFHRHKCKTCNHIWEHSDECIDDDPAHICPNCGNERRWKYRGPQAPTPLTNR